MLLHLNLHKAATLYKAASNQSPEIIVKKKGKWSLYYAARGHLFTVLVRVLQLLAPLSSGHRSPLPQASGGYQAFDTLTLASFQEYDDMIWRWRPIVEQ